MEKYKIPQVKDFRDLTIGKPLIIKSQVKGWQDWKTSDIKNIEARKAAEWLILNKLDNEQEVKSVFYSRQTSSMSDDILYAEKHDEQAIINLAEKYQMKKNNTKQPKKLPLVVNFYAGPSAGKTTAALELTAALKKEGYNVEYVSEFAKELVLENRLEELQNQEYVTNEQYHRLDRLRNSVEIIVTDSPVLLGNIYGENKISSEYANTIKEYYNSFENFNLMVKRGNSFQTEGRVHNLEQSMELDKKITDYLRANDIFYGNYHHDDIKNTVARINTTYNRLFGEHKTTKQSTSEDLKKNDSLRNNIEFIGESKKLGDFFRFRLNNPQFSLWESAKIFTSYSDITIVKEFAEWNGCERYINKGAKAYWYQNDKQENKYLFDISQTKGKTYTKEIFVKPLEIEEKLNSLLINKLENLPQGLFQQVEYYIRGYFSDYDIAADEKVINYTAKAVYSVINPKRIGKTENLDIEAFIEADKYLQQIHNELNIKRLEVEQNESKSNEFDRVGVRERVAELQSGTSREEQIDNRRSNGTRETTTSETIEGQVLSEDTINTIGNESNEVRTFGLGTQPSEMDNILGEPVRPVLRNDTSSTGERSNQELQGGIGNDVSNQPLDTSDRGTYRERDNRASGNELNYKITEQQVYGGSKTRYKSNVEAIKLVKELESEGRLATADEQKILAEYVGWGGIPEVFDNDNASWTQEHAELKELLTPQEYENAKASTLTAHYTNYTITSSIDKALKHLGLDEQAKMLEPACGIGNFLGTNTTINPNNIIGVELDSITAKIAKQLYQSSNIINLGYEQTNIADGSIDLVVTNVPFGNYKVYDKAYNSHKFLIHDYFIAKSIDKLKTGGIGVFISSKGTMDKADGSARQYIADRAELIGAIRLPNNAFKTANTEVTTDILFFKKREHQINSQDDWLYTTYNKDGLVINSYYKNNPEMVLGKLKKVINQYGDENNVEVLPFVDVELKDLLEKAVTTLPANTYSHEKVVAKEMDGVIQTDYSVENLSFTIVGDEIYQRVNDSMEKIEIPKTALPRVKELLLIRDEAKKLLDIQTTDISDEEFDIQRIEFNKIYDKFVEKYGYISEDKNCKFLRKDRDYALLKSLEQYDSKEKIATKTDIMLKRTIKPHKVVDRVESVEEALAVVMSEYGGVNIKEIENLTGKDYDTVIRELGARVYQNPSGMRFYKNDIERMYADWETAEKYLSGNVREKLRIAQGYAAEDSKFARNVQALEKNMPKEIGASEITVRLGASWIPPEYYRQFVIEKLEVYYWSRSQVDVVQNNEGQWKVIAPSGCCDYVLNEKTFGTSRRKAKQLIEDCMNLKTVNIYDRGENNERIFNKKETMLAREKQNALQKEFKKWIFSDVQRRNHLVEIYNELYNNIRLQQYDGSYLEFPGMNYSIQLRPHQKNAVHRILSNGNTLLHHCVGSGKTYTCAAAVMKAKQLGLANKPAIVVPNHLVGQWANEFKTLYPQANILMATEKDFERSARQEFLSRIATGDWDAVIIASSSFGKIKCSTERVVRKMQEEIALLEDTINSSEKGLSVKRTEKLLQTKKVELQKLLDGGMKDDFIPFEKLGIDYLVVDEAHYYKNRLITTNMNNVAGINNAKPSQRAIDMDMKVEYINEVQKGPKGVIFATGTPISNSMCEMYTMQAYLQRGELRNCNMHYFDGWASNFGETITALELAPSGQGYRSKTRFSKFINLPELLTMYRSFADVQTADMLKLPVPEAEKHIIKLPSTKQTELYNDELVDRADRINGGGVDPSEDNMLKITTDGKKLALDCRLYDSNAIDEPNNKINACVENVYKIWNDTADTRSTQVIFCDMSTPKKSYEQYNPAVDFDVYNDIKHKLVERGVPADEIRFIHEAGGSDIKKQELFTAVRNGDVRVLLGSTQKCGAGTNIQTKLKALHHLDTPYRPSDMEQREGRIVRQGNENTKVDIYTYITEKTFDSYSYQILENKQKFISQIDKGDLTVREAQDIDEQTLNYAEIKAIVTANPLIKRKMEIQQEISRLELLENDYRTQRYQLQDNVAITYPKQISTIENTINNMKIDIKTKNNNTQVEFSMIINGKVYSEKKDAGDIIKLACNKKDTGYVIGQYRGFDIIVGTKATDFGNSLLAQDEIFIKGANTYKIEIGDSSIGLITRVENCINNLDKKLLEEENNLQVVQNKVRNSEALLQQPFEYEEQIDSLRNELSEIDNELNLDNNVIEVVEDKAVEQIDSEIAELEQAEIINSEIVANNQATIAKATQRALK